MASPEAERSSRRQVLLAGVRLRQMVLITEYFAFFGPEDTSPEAGDGVVGGCDLQSHEEACVGT